MIPLPGAHLLFNTYTILGSILPSPPPGWAFTRGPAPPFGNLPKHQDIAEHPSGPPPEVLPASFEHDRFPSNDRMTSSGFTTFPTSQRQPAESPRIDTRQREGHPSPEPQKPVSEAGSNPTSSEDEKEEKKDEGEKEKKKEKESSSDGESSSSNEEKKEEFKKTAEELKQEAVMKGRTKDLEKMKEDAEERRGKIARAGKSLAEKAEETNEETAAGKAEERQTKKQLQERPKRQTKKQQQERSKRQKSMKRNGTRKKGVG